MRDVVILFVHLIVTVVRLARPGGLRSVVAESVLVKHQLRILNRGRKRAGILLETLQCGCAGSENRVVLGPSARKSNFREPQLYHTRRRLPRDFMNSPC